MIRPFRDPDAEAVFNWRRVRHLPADLQPMMNRKLRMLHRAEKLEDLRVPPGNRLELLKGDRKGQHSIRVNDQWRVCFVWTDEGPENVELVDYHR